MMEILIPVIIVAAIGLVLGLGLALAGKFLSEAPDEKFEAIRNALPGANCGACGFTGCDDYANAVKDGTAEPNLCIPGGKDTAAKLSEVLGVEVDTKEKVAFVACNGDCFKASTKFAYSGVATCDNLVAVFTPRFEADPQNLDLAKNIVKMMTVRLLPAVATVPIVTVCAASATTRRWHGSATQKRKRPNLRQHLHYPLRKGGSLTHD